ncbi:metallophosphoesterase family protein [Oceanibium sediminis]|uniref:metallophosphoesterase family protein n=1 Tax=Oceanibium sediminis TaxID=2026339 RepID=UPI001300726B|nr:metallophosphoesterase [Oceanibium sediminis]
MRFAHVSDLHLSDSVAPGGASTPATARRVAAAVADDLAEISAGLDFIVVSGDLTEAGEPACFATFEELFAPLPVPVFVVPGNHDGPTAMRSYQQTSKRLADWDLTNRVVELGDVRLLGLDTCIDKCTTGALGEDALALVRAEVRRAAESRLVIVMHHPPLLLGQKVFDGFCSMERGDAFLSILAAVPRPTLVLAGHVHRPYQATSGTITCCVAGSMVAPCVSDLPFGAMPIRPAPVQDHYFVHELLGPDHHVVTPQRVAALAG